ncbi:MAG: class I SAM-dependent methyltransferase, partial [Planctomycetota bacterium]
MRSGVQTFLSFTRNPLSLVSREARPARCNVCGYVGRLLLRWTYRRNLRETLGCPRCGSISRDRMLVSVMSEAVGRPPILADWPPDPSIRVLEPSARRGRARILGTKVEYHAVEYPRVDLESLPYEVGRFDWVVAADVFEHVRRDGPAFREVLRVLRPGGWFFLQVPFDPERETLLR